MPKLPKLPAPPLPAALQAPPPRPGEGNGKAGPLEGADGGGHHRRRLGRRAHLAERRRRAG